MPSGLGMPWGPPEDEQEEVTKDYVRDTLLSPLLLQPRPRKAAENGWIEGLCAKLYWSSKTIIKPHLTYTAHAESITERALFKT